MATIILNNCEHTRRVDLSYEEIVDLLNCYRKHGDKEQTLSVAKVKEMYNFLPKTDY